MTREYVGPDGAFTIRYPDDWVCARHAIQTNELDSLMIHRAEAAIGALRVTAYRLKDEPANVSKFIDRMKVLYAKPIEEETKVLDWIQGPLGGKQGFIRVSQGQEGGVHTLIQMHVVGAGRTVLMANYVAPLLPSGTPAAKEESRTIVQMILEATLA